MHSPQIQALMESLIHSCRNFRSPWNLLVCHNTERKERKHFNFWAKLSQFLKLEIRVFFLLYVSNISLGKYLGGFCLSFLHTYTHKWRTLIMYCTKFCWTCLKSTFAVCHHFKIHFMVSQLINKFNAVVFHIMKASYILFSTTSALMKTLLLATA